MPHVDGLRALAVLSVILFHLDVAYTPGGFVGVDIFFVISGFLITRLIYKELQTTGRFDFSRFYIRRMRRLFPALFATLAVTAGVAIIVLSPGMLAKFGATLAAAALSVSNILFWSQSGYFDTRNVLKPLLHTWSLSVEEQFYLIWPALLWLLMSRWSMRGAAVAGALIAVGIASFALNALWVFGNLGENYKYTIFFLTPFRVFEFAIGGVGLFLLNAVRNRIVLQEVFMALGLSLIGYSVMSFGGNLNFPYWHGLVPSVGALLVILSGQSTRVGLVLTNRIAVFIGLISYSVYLVHWPLIVLYNYITLTPLTDGNKLALLVVIFALAFLMYRYIETPFRTVTPGAARSNPHRNFVTSGVGAMLVSFVLGVTIWSQDGWGWRQPAAFTQAQIDAGMERRVAPSVSSSCKVLELKDTARCKLDRPYQVLVFGDSHEPDAYNAFDAIYGSNRDVNLITFGTTNSCDLAFASGVPYSRPSGRDCDKRFKIIADSEFVMKLDAVVLSANGPFFSGKQFFWDTLALMQRVNPKLSIVVLGGYINTTLNCAELFNRTGTFDTCKEKEFVGFVPFDERQNGNAKVPADLRYLYIDKTVLLCSDKTLKSCQVEIDGEPYAYDGNHLSYAFARMMGRKIAATYGADLEKLGFPALPARGEAKTAFQ